MYNGQMEQRKCFPGYGIVRRKLKQSWRKRSMGKLRKLFFEWFDNQIEKSFQRTANKIQKETDKINQGRNK